MKHKFYNFEGIKLHYYLSNEIDPEKISLIFLHGFTGDASDWFFLSEKFSGKYNLVFIDLPGHGRSIDFSNKSVFTTDSMCSQLSEILKIELINRAVLTGYSMGGRLAILFSLYFPQKVEGLFLESTTAGIESRSEKNDRYKSDLILTEKIPKEGIDKFIDYWFELPLFESLKVVPLNEFKSIVNKRKQNSPEGIANSLKGFSQGLMPSAWDHLSKINAPVKLITGSLDSKFSKINSRMNSLLPNSKHVIIDSAGHNIHLEKPEEFIILLDSFLRTLNS